MEKKAVFKNASWIVGCKIVQSVVGLFVGMQTARYLGPDNYGLINYAAAVTAFFVPVMQLGFRSTLVREIVESPCDEGEILGTALTLNMISAFACIIGIAAFAAIANAGETDTLIVCVLYSTSLIFQALEMIQYWFQAKLLSQYTAIVSVIAYIAVSAYKIFLLVTQKNIYWFAISQVLDYALIAFSLIIIYTHKYRSRLTFSWRRGKAMFHISKYYIVSSLMVTIFGHTDSIMLKLMLNETATGYYSVAVSCATLTSFVFGAIIDSMRPAILEDKKKTQSGFQKSMKQLISAIFWIAMIQSIFIVLVSNKLVVFLYGNDYQNAASALRIVTWYSAFSYLGSVRSIWILAEERHHVLWIVNAVGALGNVLLNGILIPIWGIEGAAIASVLTQLFTNVGINWIIPAYRPYNKLLVQGVNPKYAVSLVRTILGKE